MRSTFCTRNSGHINRLTSKAVIRYYVVFICGARRSAKRDSHNSCPTNILGPEINLVRGCENVAGKLRQKWKATAGSNFTKPHTSIISGPSTPLGSTEVG